MLEAGLLAILDAGPIDPGALAALSRSRRRSALLGIESLIALLDALDGDPDLEPDVDDEDGGDTEQSLGSPEVADPRDRYTNGIAAAGTLNQARWSMGANCLFTSDAEAVDEDGGDINDQPHDGDGEDLEDGADMEPSLGWTEGLGLDQRWSWGHHFGDSEQGETRPPKRRVPHTAPPGVLADDALDRLRAIRGLPPRRRKPVPGGMDPTTASGLLPIF